MLNAGSQISPTQALGETTGVYWVYRKRVWPAHPSPVCLVRQAGWGLEDGSLAPGGYFSAGRFGRDWERTTLYRFRIGGKSQARI